MSISQWVAFRGQHLPSIFAIQDAARELGFALALDPTDLSTHSGFLPATLGGRTAGFEWFLAHAGEHPEHADAIGDRDTVATFVTHSDETEAQSAIVCAAALLVLTRGVYFDDAGAVCTTPEPLVEEVRAWIARDQGPRGARPTPRVPEPGGVLKLLSRLFRR